MNTLNPAPRNKSVELPLFMRHSRKQTIVSNPDAKHKELHERLLQEQSRREELERHIAETETLLCQKSIDYEDKIHRLKTQMKTLRDCPSPSLESMKFSIGKVEDLYKKLHEGIDGFKEDYKREFGIQERGIIRAFDQRLLDIFLNFQEKRQRKAEELEEIQKQDVLKSKEFEILRSSAYTIQSRNKQLEEENKNLKNELENRDLEFNLLVGKYNSLKKKKEKENEYREETSMATPVSSKKKRFPSDLKMVSRLEGVINRLRKQLEIERRNLRAARTAYSRELENKTELEKLLRNCIDDIRAEIAKKKGNRKGESEEDRKLIIDRLLTTEEVLRHVYDKTFPLSEGLSRGSPKINL